MDLRHIFLNTDYTYVTRFVGAVIWIGIPAEIFYFFFETSHGYWDSIYLRSLLVLSIASLRLRNWKKASGWLAILHWEIVLFLVFPFQSTLALLQNHAISYYASSLSIMAFILGMLTKGWMVPIHFIFGSGITTMLFVAWKGANDEILAANLEAQINALFAGSVSAAVMLVLESYHRRITIAQVALAKADEEKKKATEMAKAYEELKKREELIRVYVRPSLVDEIHAGEDPSKAPPVIRNLSVMFCDIRGFTGLTEVLNPYEKQTFLNQYFTMMTHPIARNRGEVDKIMGDCVMGLFPDGHSAINAAIDMQLELQRFNEKMVQMNSPVIRNGIGIAKGDVMQGNFGSFEKLDRTVIGETVNIASRLEAKTKMYNVEVVVTENVIQDLPDESSHYRWIDVVQVKGSSRRLKLYEVYGHQMPEVRRFKDETRDLLEKALTIYFQKGFRDASRLFKAMRQKMLSRASELGGFTDEILQYYISHCDTWINHRDGDWTPFESWEGVHIFNEK